MSNIFQYIHCRLFLTELSVIWNQVNIISRTQQQTSKVYGNAYAIQRNSKHKIPDYLDEVQVLLSYEQNMFWTLAASQKYKYTHLQHVEEGSNK
jgi:hypothetical protein